MSIFWRRRCPIRDIFRVLNSLVLLVCIETCCASTWRTITLNVNIPASAMRISTSSLPNSKQDDPILAFDISLVFLRKSGIRVQYRRIIHSIRRIDRLGQALRTRRVMTRRKYHVERPNALWHMDGHHKLIRWGIVIHAFIDGFCRTVCFLKWNRTATNSLLRCFR